MYRTFARPNQLPSTYNADTIFPVSDSISDSEFKANADIADGCNGQRQINTNYDNTETDSNAVNMRSDFDMSENVDGNTTSANKHWLRK